MHIPDGLIAPQAWLAAGALAAPAWAWGVRRVVRRFDESGIPRLAVLTALALVLSSVMIPLPGGTSAHLIGIGLLAISFGVWPTFIAFSLVLLLQAVLLGAGGITSLPINALAMGLAGPAMVIAGRRALDPLLSGTRAEPLAVIVPVWLGITLAALLIALALGIQPALGVDGDGNPLYFPFGPAVTVPVIVGPHLLIGLIEGVLTWLVLAALPVRQAAT